MSAIEINNLNIAYEIRVIGERPWYRELLKANYTQKTVLKDISLQMSLGSVVAILGKNGSGKTTLVKAMAGLLKPSNGDIQVLGFNPHLHENNFLRQISVVFGQKRMLWPELSLAENFEFLSAIYKIPKAEQKSRTLTLAAQFRLTELLRRQLKTFSLGETMRCEVAAALIHQPQILFLDEPTVGMDIESQIAMREAIREYGKQHECLVILTSHNTKDIVALASRILLLADQNISEFAITPGLALSEDIIEKRLLQK